MLIISDRQTAKDLEIWREYEECDAIRSTGSRLESKERLAISALDRFVSTAGAYIGVSWGKDSVVVADLALRHGLDLPLVHLYCSPSHNYYCDSVRNEFLKLYPNAKYTEVLCDYGDIYSRNLPDPIQDLLTDEIWYASWEKVNDMFVDRHISGIRGQESGIRSIRMRRWGMSTDHTCAPIGYWHDNDVFAYLYKYNLPVHPNYAMLGDGRYSREHIRVSEIGDIHGNQAGRAVWEREYYPDILNRIFGRGV
jgi:phosphoadenosine phosphosulfate reductase